MDKIARQPQADWFGDWNADVASAVARRMATITAAGALPVLVAYAIPGRDCGSYSAGGEPSPEAYRRWIAGFVRGVSHRTAVVVLEPDALAEIDCLAPTARRTRMTLLRFAVADFREHSRASVYIDAGTAGWHPAAVMAARLRAAGIDRARGFALNVSNFRTTADVISYGNAISHRVGGKRFLVDTSRNGVGPLPRSEWRTPEDGWCNPPGRALGAGATTATASRRADAYFWIKRPGESDGTCNGGPPAGVWWPEYALALARAASR